MKQFTQNEITIMMKSIECIKNNMEKHFELYWSDDDILQKHYICWFNDCLKTVKEIIWEEEYNLL